MLDLIDADISSSDSESEDYSEDVKLIDKYRENILKNPLDYDCHFRLIKALRFSDKLIEAREAREKMNEYYPLSPDLWLEWISDERSGNSDKDFIKNLFMRAINDYRSAFVWSDYCQFILGYMTDKNEVREVFETAISQVGTHLPSAYLVWGTYLIYENLLLSNCVDLADIAEQRLRIYKLYLRQLSIPLKGNDETYKEFLEWNVNNKFGIDEIKAKYEESEKLIQNYLIFEEKIKNAICDYIDNQTNNDTNSKEESWLSYLQYAEDHLSKCEIINLYERAITDICLSQPIWVKYLNYLTKFFEKDEERILTAYQRAVRNYKSSSEIWLGLVRYMERFDRPVEDIRKTFNAMYLENFTNENAFITVWKAYLIFERRQFDKLIEKQSEDKEFVLDLDKIRDHCERLLAAEDYTFYDPQCILIKYWVFIEAKYGKNLPKCRELWGMIIKLQGNIYSSLWLEILQFERNYGDFDHFKRNANNAINCLNIDYPEYLFEQIRRMIDEDGDLITDMQFAKKIDLQMKKINERRILQSNNESEKSAANNKSRNLKRKTPDIKSPDSKSKKVKFTNDVEKESPKKVIVPNETIVTPVEKCDEKSIYISNLNFKVTENDLRTKFENCGKVVDVRLVKDGSDKSRGFAYIQFDKIEDVEEALKMEREILMERPMFVNRNDPSKRHSFQYNVGVVEKTKLFVKNLPKTITKYALENVFAAYGSVKDVRIVTFKTGQPKGIAYVEFFNEDDASKALVGTDGCVIGDKTIEVNLSKPPAKPQHSIEEMTSPVTVGTSSNMFMIPRNVQKPALTRKKLIHGQSSDNEEIVVTDKKSNNDFRAFLK